jgi:hypothetical protein
MASLGVFDAQSTEHVKLSRIIADLPGSDVLGAPHVAEVVQFRPKCARAASTLLMRYLTVVGRGSRRRLIRGEG